MNKQPVAIRPELISSDISAVVCNASISAFTTIIARQKWKIVGMTLMSGLSVAALFSRLAPLYEGTAEISIDRSGALGVVGPEASAIAPGNDMDQLLTTDVETLQSDAILRPVTQQFKLLEEEGQLAGKSAEEVAQIKSGPTKLKRLKVTRPPNTYILRISYQAHNRRLAADVANAIANAYAERAVELQAQSAQDRAAVMEREVLQFKAKMMTSEASLAALERELSVPGAGETASPLQVRYNQLNIEFAGAQNELARKGAALKAVRDGSIAAAQSTPQSETLARALERLGEARQRFSQTKAVYGPNYTEYRKAVNEINELTAQVEEIRANTGRRLESDYNQSLAHQESLAAMVTQTKTQIDRSSTSRHRYDQLRREAELDRRLYEDMIRRMKEYQINGAFRHGLARLSDAALPSSTPVFPNIPLTVAIASVAALLLAVFGVLVVDSFDQSLRDAEQVARTLHTEFLGALPELSRNAVSSKLAQTPGRESVARSLSRYEEAIRTLRNTLSLSDQNKGVRTILLTSAVRAEGKSTTVLHLAEAFASHGKRTLIIDADLRRPSMDKMLRVFADKGLAGALEGRHCWREAVLSVPWVRNLSLLPAGLSAMRPSDLIGDGIATVLNESAAEFDIVLVDAPPLLAFAETVQIAIAADAVVLVAQAGRTPGKAVSTVITSLQRTRANVLGLILNRTRQSTSTHDYSYGRAQHAMRESQVPKRLLDRSA